MAKKGCCGAPAYNKLVTFQSPGGARDAVGERSTTWTNQFDAWVAIAPVRVSEFLAAGELQGKLTHRVQARFSAALAAVQSKWRILYGARVLVIEGPPRNLEEADRVVEFLCGEGLREE
jgi:SPP1 family predicted phage head-tail adaptor